MVRTPDPVIRAEARLYTGIRLIQNMPASPAAIKIGARELIAQNVGQRLINLQVLKHTGSSIDPADDPDDDTEGYGINLNYEDAAFLADTLMNLVRMMDDDPKFNAPGSGYSITATPDETAIALHHRRPGCPVPFTEVDFGTDYSEFRTLISQHEVDVHGSGS